jgi:mannose/fructose/N-acetylgalactosamine-specific phosphotransferase system component IID
MFIRSFFIQTVYNYQSLLSIGFCYALSPILNKLYQEKESRKRFLYQHLNFFNAHPYFASYAIGAIARIEENQSKEKKEDTAIIERFKNALIGPLGAIGDQLFWETIRPACIFIAITGIVFLPTLHFKLMFLLIVLTLYNIPHISIRLYGLWAGYRRGFDIYKLLNLEKYRKLKMIYMTLGATALGLFTGYHTSSIGDTKPTHLFVFIITIMVTYIYRKYKQSFYGIILISLSTALILGLIIEQL